MNEGTESPKFVSNFNVWNPPKPLTFGSTVSAGVAKTRADEDIDISALLSTTPAEDVGFNKGGKITIWRIENFDKAPFDEDLYGQFWGGDSYIVLYSYKNHDQDEHAIYFWLGDTSSQDERGTLITLVVHLNTFAETKMHFLCCRCRCHQSTRIG